MHVWTSSRICHLAYRLAALSPQLIFLSAGEEYSLHDKTTVIPQTQLDIAPEAHHAAHPHLWCKLRKPFVTMLSVNLNCAAKATNALLLLLHQDTRILCGIHYITRTLTDKHWWFPGDADTSLIYAATTRRTFHVGCKQGRPRGQWRQSWTRDRHIQYSWSLGTNNSL